MSPRAWSQESEGQATEAVETASGQSEEAAETATSDESTGGAAATEATTPESDKSAEPAPSEADTAEAGESADAAEQPPAEAAAPDADETADDDAAGDEPADEDVDEEEPAAADEETVDWEGLIERAPPFFALFHHASVHMPIALWLFGALFVVLGVFAPSVRTQIPLACLLVGTVTAVAATATGWWYAEHSWGEAWTFEDGIGEWDEHLVKHRWTGVMLVASSLVLSVLALISQAKKSKWLGFIWRVGLLLLAAAVSWEGHLGGELIHGEGYLEEAYEVWINPEGE